MECIHIQTDKYRGDIGKKENMLEKIETLQTETPLQILQKDVFQEIV